jgi:arylsulfatase A-like enzyme
MSTRPNILMLMADPLTPGALPAYGSHEPLAELEASARFPKTGIL